MANVKRKSIPIRSFSVVDDLKTAELSPIVTCTCDECESEKNVNYCSACSDFLCDTCWDKRRKHRENRPGPGGIPHEKNHPSIVESVKKRTAEPQDNVEQTKLHKDDEDTTWIGLRRDTGGDPVLAEYRRYAAIMMDSATEDGASRCPRLVSFIGETAAGKSTLIKLLLDANGDTDESATSSAPVIGRAALETPTSADVHLYLDPKSSTTPYPILLADCEGFNGGEGDPVATQAIDGISSNPTKSQNQRMPKSRMSDVIQRPLQWAKRENAATEEKRKRSYAVPQMYPRIFYAFSDVVVYVLKNPRTLEEVVEKLLNWAHTHRQKSINVPTKPHVVIAINQSHHSTPNEQWNSITATAHLLASTTAKINKNETFQRYADAKQNANFNITNMRDLLKCYYYDIHVVRLPDKERFELLHDQAQTLYKVISDCCDESTEYKKSKQLLPNADQLGLYLKMAFDHFAHSLDVPFDYIEASLRHQPPPVGFDDSLLVFTKMVARRLGLFEKREAASNRELFDRLTPLISSCIMLDCSRKQRFGLAKEWFSNSIAGQNRASYERLCADVIAAYCRCYAPGGQVLRSSPIHAWNEHRPGEQWGTYKSEFDCRTYNWPGKILQDLKELEKTYSRLQETSSTVHVRSATHQKRLRDFYESAGGADRFKANSICLCCLSGPPEYHLPCGHVLCAACAQDFGRRTASRLEIDACPLHDHNGIERISTSPTIFGTYPAHSGLRVLVLDGGGARGIVELTIMKAIEKRLDVPLQSFFDLVIGTSTGGIIALGFGDQLWPVEKCIDRFKNLVKKAFTYRPMQTTTHLLKWVEMLVKQSRYRTQPLVEALQDAFGEKTVLFGSQRSHEDYRRLKVGVTATTSADNNAKLLANFYTPGTSAAAADPTMAYQHVRPNVPANEMKVWEAARATSAAPGYFRPFDKELDSQDQNGEMFEELVDGGLFHNNPINIAYQEALNIANTHNLSEIPDMVLSLGTGLPKGYSIDETKRQQSRLDQIRDVVQKKKPYLMVMINMVNEQIKLNLDSERRWNMWEQNTCKQGPGWQNKRFRLNPDIGVEPPPMDDWEKVDALENSVRGWIGIEEVSDKIDIIVRTLVASSFYFERTGSASAPRGSAVGSGSMGFKGTIKCRLSDSPSDVRGLGRFLERCRTAQPDSVMFVVDRAKGGGEDLEIEIPISSMVEYGRFDPLLVQMRLPAEQEKNMISLSMRGHSYPISGFPRSLLKEDFGVA